MKSVIMGKSDSKCVLCDETLVWKTHPKITAKELKRPFYFLKWEYCVACKSVWLHEEFKVWNKNLAAQIQKNYEEYGEQLAHLRSIE